MSILVWDEIDKRFFETGIDRGVLYLQDGSAIPWNGLVSVIEQSDRSVSPIYYDGKKINDLVSLGTFKGVLKAITYPDEFYEIEGLEVLKDGVYLTERFPKLFGLSYRTKIGNAIEGDSFAYKIHIIYNLTAIANDKTFNSISDSPSFSEFEWNITAIPEEITGKYPTAQIIVDSRFVDPLLLVELEKKLYGSSDEDAVLIPMSELVDFIENWYRIQITDNGDGTWTATSIVDENITVDMDGLFTITEVNAEYLDSSTYVVSDT